jgi:hypothetical protein
MGQMLALTLMTVVSFLAGERDGLALYPRWAILTGLTFFVMGGTFWGGCYLLGLSFFAVALLMPFAPAGSPVGLGALLGVALAVVGVRLRRLGREPAA